MKPLIVHAQAEAEAAHEAHYYEDRAASLGLEFLADLERAFVRIRQAPARWRRGPHGTRQVSLARFPHTVYYRDLPDAVWVVAVAPQKRQPFYWRSRLS